MAHLDTAQVESRRTVVMAGAAAYALGSLIWRAIRLAVYGVLVICGPVLRVGATTLATLGILSAVVLEFSGSAPRFPFWQAMMFFGCCGMLPLLHRGALRLFAP